MKKRFPFVVALALGLGLAVTPVRSQNNLVLKLTDGSEKSTALSSLGTITFSGANTILNFTDGKQAVYASSTIRKMFFAPGSSAAVESPFQDAPGLALYPNPAVDYLWLKNAPAGGNAWAICRIDGAVVLTGKLQANAGIDVRNLASGFYIIRVNNQAMKFMKL